MYFRELTKFFGPVELAPLDSYEYRRNFHFPSCGTTCQTDTGIQGTPTWLLPCAYYARELYSLLAQPLLDKLPQGGQMIATEVITPFFVPMKVAMMAAFIITLPHTLYQIWAFVAPGLYSHEKRLVLPLVFVSSFLFICGMAFAYFAALPLVFEFITHFAPEGVAVMTDIGSISTSF